MSSSHKGVNLLGAATEYGDATVLEYGDSFAGGMMIRFPDHLQTDLGEKLTMLLDQMTYFVAEEQIELLCFPAGSRHLNRLKSTGNDPNKLSEIATSEHSGRFAQQSGRRSNQVINWTYINIPLSVY